MNKLGIWAAIIVGLTFGANSLIVKSAYIEGIKVMELLFYQYVFTVLWFSGKAFIKRKNKVQDEQSSFKYLLSNKYSWLVGICGVLTALFYYSSIHMTDPISLHLVFINTPG